MPRNHLDDSKASLNHLLCFTRAMMAQGTDMETMAAHDLKALSPVALAYMGDAVFELFVRGALLTPPKRIRNYHRQVVNQVRAEQQAHYLQQLFPLLTEAEQEILRRGRNASPKGPKRVDGQTYQQATSFEALIGYLYLTNLDRLVELLSQLDMTEQKEC